MSPFFLYQSVLFSFCTATAAHDFSDEGRLCLPSSVGMIRLPLDWGFLYFFRLEPIGPRFDHLLLSYPMTQTTGPLLFHHQAGWIPLFFRFCCLLFFYFVRRGPLQLPFLASTLFFSSLVYNFPLWPFFSASRILFDLSIFC